MPNALDRRRRRKPAAAKPTGRLCLYCYEHRPSACLGRQGMAFTCCDDCAQGELALAHLTWLEIDIDKIT